MKKNNQTRIILGLFAFILIIGILLGYILGFIHASSVLTSEFNNNLRWHYSAFKINSTSFFNDNKYTFDYRVNDNNYVCYLLT